MLCGDTTDAATELLWLSVTAVKLTNAEQWLVNWLPSTQLMSVLLSFDNWLQVTLVNASNRAVISKYWCWLIDWLRRQLISVLLSFMDIYLLLTGCTHVVGSTLSALLSLLTNQFIADNSSGVTPQCFVYSFSWLSVSHSLVCDDRVYSLWFLSSIFSSFLPSSVASYLTDLASFLTVCHEVTDGYLVPSIAIVHPLV